MTDAMPAMHQLVQTAQTAALEAGKAIMEVYRSDVFGTTRKEKMFPVTKADRVSHTLIINALLQTGLPVLSEEGQEMDYQKRMQWDMFWLVDPLDGTEEFLHKRDEFTINIALIVKQTAVAGVIYVPCSDRMYIGSKETGVFKVEKNASIQFTALPKRISIETLRQKENITITVSRSHLSKETSEFAQQFLHPQFLSKGSALKFMMLLEGQADIYPRLGPTMEWDTAAAHAILNASGRGVYLLDFETELTYNKPDLHNPFFIAF